MHIDLSVALDATTARRLTISLDTLVLKLPDGWCQDFQVAGVSGTGGVIRVNAMGDLRKEA